MTAAINSGIVCFMALAPRPQHNRPEPIERPSPRPERLELPPGRQHHADQNQCRRHELAKVLPLHGPQLIRFARQIRRRREKFLADEGVVARRHEERELRVSAVPAICNAPMELPVSARNNDSA